MGGVFEDRVKKRNFENFQENMLEFQIIITDILQVMTKEGDQLVLNQHLTEIEGTGRRVIVEAHNFFVSVCEKGLF